ncbi:MAG TPA: EAL domain-containing protein [Tepidisphaeraceae bacterium]|nr:EAL domain-containing protein [Tepidisphaeraceae bacterium]
MPFVQPANLNGTCGEEVEYLLISPPNSVTSRRVRVQMMAAGLETVESEMGLRVSVGGMDWRMVLEALGMGLSEAERQDTRVATGGADDDLAAIHRAIFRAQSVEGLLSSAADEWFEQVLSRGRIAVYFQPLVQYPPGRLHGYECLMRGVDEDGQIIAPTRMFEAARRLGKIAELDDKCRSAAIAAAAHMKTTGVNFFINVIPSAIREPKRFLNATLAELDAGGLRPQDVTFEVVETEKVHDQRQLMNLLAYYRKAGFKVALDDVGAGYSSLLSLSKLRPDYIKLEGELVRRAAQSSLEAKIVADLAETARQNGIITIAEGIETAEELRLVLDCGIRVTQGFFHAKPQPRGLTAEETGEIVDRAAGVARGWQESHAGGVGKPTNFHE